jgi:hypothetical protein
MKDLRHRSVLLCYDMKDQKAFQRSAFYYHFLYWENVSCKDIFSVHLIGICKVVFVLEHV